ncbi:hypothetical protein QYM36_002751 [Artemia franciscana]|uniref:C3H1-type domain-containing protein n=1 Tax=Artemia franciscana TaxID=6661 RepID=A0AA88LF32_ARTSF|nr:hypothetical protein QYM36_002751 [Artemia franciscana]
MGNITFEEFMLEMRNEIFKQRAFKIYNGDHTFRSHNDEGREKQMFRLRMKSELFAGTVYSLVNGTGFTPKNTAEVATTQETPNQQEQGKSEADLSTGELLTDGQIAKPKELSLYESLRQRLERLRDKNGQIAKQIAKKNSIYDRLGPHVRIQEKHGQITGQISIYERLEPPVSIREKPGKEFYKKSSKLAEDEKFNPSNFRRNYKPNRAIHAGKTGGPGSQPQIKFNRNKQVRGPEKTPRANLINKRCKYGRECYNDKCAFIH